VTSQQPISNMSYQPSSPSLSNTLHARSPEQPIHRLHDLSDEHDRKIFVSYYAAHHINKVLFRTELERNLLHRMRCRNPLNNMPIIDEVEYFIITPQQVEHAYQVYYEGFLHRWHKLT